MAQNRRLIDADETITKLRDYADRKHYAGHNDLANGILKAVSYIRNEIVRVDAVEVVRCEKCVHGIPAEDDDIPNCYMCVEAAEFDPESGLYAGFTSYHTGDFYCGYGERRNNG